MEYIFKNSTAFLCTKDVLYTTGSPEKIGKVSFTKDKIYFIELQCYLIDDRGIHKNYAWFKNNFVAAPEHDKAQKPKRIKPARSGKIKKDA